MKRNLVSIAVSLLIHCVGAYAQNMTISTNLLSYVNLGTLNFETSYALAQHWSANAGIRYNPFTFLAGDDGSTKQARQQTYSLGMRWWPWHIYSGWWMAAKAQFQEYNIGGFYSEETNEGERYGGGVTAGYTYMLGRHFNLEFGAGVWAGQDDYTTYACPSCGRTLDSGNKFFVMLNDVLLSVSYVF